MEEALASAGLPGSRSHAHSDHRPLIKAFVKASGRGAALLLAVNTGLRCVTSQAAE